MSEVSSYVDAIVGVLERRRISFRELAQRTGLAKSRIALVLHRNPERRSIPSLDEYRLVLKALGLSPLEIVLQAEVIPSSDWPLLQRHPTLIAMLVRLFEYMPVSMLRALQDIDDLDGTEVRPEWAAGLERWLVKRVVQEIKAVAQRRAAMTDVDAWT